MNTLAPKIVQGQTNVIKCNSDFSFGTDLVVKLISLVWT